MLRQNYQLTETISKKYLTDNDFILDNTVNGFVVRNLPLEYKINLQVYRHPVKENSWNVQLISIYRNDTLLCSFVRNYHHLPILYVKQNDTDYLITSSNYQTITIINLSNGEIKSYVDIDDFNYGCGFCPVYFDWDDEDNTLSVEGCIWACPYEIMICENIDLSNPIESFNNATWKYADDDDIDEDEDEVENTDE